MASSKVQKNDKLGKSGLWRPCVHPKILKIVFYAFLSLRYASLGPNSPYCIHSPLQHATVLFLLGAKLGKTAPPIETHHEFACQWRNSLFHVCSAESMSFIAWNEMIGVIPLILAMLPIVVHLHWANASIFTFALWKATNGLLKFPKMELISIWDMCSWFPPGMASRPS